MADDVRSDTDLVAPPTLERKTRRLFWGSLILSAIVAFHFLFTTGRIRLMDGVLTPLLPVALLWSLVLTGYAFHMVYELAQERGRKLNRAYRDEGTGVFTLDYLEAYLEQEKKRAAGEKSAGTVVLYLDMVGLEKVNRTMGHAVGDIVLNAAGQLIADNARPGDVVGRVGGDEFLIIMPEATPEEAQEAVSRIREAIEAYEFEVGKKGTINYLSCRAGAARLPANGDTPDEVISTARDRLVAANAAGPRMLRDLAASPDIS